MNFLSKIIFLTVSFILTACSGRDEPFSPAEGDVTPQIVFLFSPGGLGDMSYNDCILQGVQRFKKSHPEVDVFMSSPESMEVAERIFSDWMKRPGSDIPVVFALASSDFESFVDKYAPQYPLSDNKRILLFESLKKYDDPRITTFQISMYGASFLAGETARVACEGKRSLVLLGSSTDIPVESARDGFVAGWNGNDYDIEYLADDWTGYVMANATYQRMADWASAYGFIFPVAGGSNAGLYRYTREFDDSPLLAGMDIDQSGLSNKIVGSVVKRLDVMVEEYFSLWLATGDMPAPQIYGLESGYVDWLLSPYFYPVYQHLSDDWRPVAVEKEKEYYGL